MYVENMHEIIFQASNAVIQTYFFDKQNYVFEVKHNKLINDA